MAKLAKIILTKAFDPESEEQMLKSNVLVAGKGRTRSLPSREVDIPDIELEDDPSGRRVFVGIPGRARVFIPYEHVWRAEVLPEAAPAVAKAKR